MIAIFSRLRNLLGLSLLLSLSLSTSFSQGTNITGKVTDANTGDPVPFANIIFINTSIGTTTDFDGNYVLETNNPTDSITASYIGYKPKNRPLLKGRSQVVNFQLEEDVISLQEVVVMAGENPAFEILRRVVENKDRNNKNSLEAYQYETYTKIEVDVDNISDKLKQRKVMRKISQVMDSVEQIAGEDGKPILPLFISESISEYYVRNNPHLRHEKILKTKISGVGIEDGSLTSQFVGSSFQEYNFYNNWMTIVSKEFVSPIVDSWRLYYEYDLTDSLDVEGHYCYRLDFFPKSEQDLAFKGMMWITRDEYALRRIDVTVSKSANLNYIEKIKIQQELEPTSAGPWIPTKNRVLIDIGEITNKSAGMLTKFYTSNRNIVINKLHDNKFYDRPILLAEDYNVGSDDEYWNTKRHEPLSDTELHVIKMIDTLRNIPVVKTYTELLKIAFNGYKKVGKVDIGPYLSAYANNTVEGQRFQLGFKTNISFSDKWIFGGRLAYGTNDEKFKYQGFTEYIASRAKWTKFGIYHTKDIDQVGLAEDDLLGNSVFLTASKFGDLIKPYEYKEGKVSFERELIRGLSQKVIFKHREYRPILEYFPFAYYEDPNASDLVLKTNFTTSEVILETRFAKDELHIQNDNERVSLGTRKWPIVTLRYTHGLKGVLNSNFDYQKLALNIKKNIKMGFFGTSNISLLGERIFSELPYPLLKAHIGNESSFYTTAAFNLMNYSEFVSDEYVAVKYRHYFEGFILNRIPLMKKLKWRLLATTNILYGSLSDNNKAIIPPTDEMGNAIQQPGALSATKPYVEVGYGIENIFKVIRIDAVHRITYLDNPEVNKFGIKLSFQFIL